MSQYILLLHGPVDQDADASPAEMQKIIENYMVWGEKTAAAGKLAGGQKLSYDRGKVLSPDGVVRDGPFSETKEVIGGYFMLEVSGYDEAVELAKTCPHHLRGLPIEVRRVDLEHAE